MSDPNRKMIYLDDALKALRPIMRKSDYYYEIQKAIQDVPPAQPEQKKGRWEMLQIPISPPVYKCSVCGNHALQTVTGCLVNRHFEANLTDFCPFCGADMRGKQDEKCR